MVAEQAFSRWPRRTATAAEADALASDVRLRIIRLTFHRPLTNKELAQRLDKDPATTLHHVRKLVDTGFLEALPPRRGNRGAREIPYQSTGKSWRMSHQPSADSTLAVQEAMLQAFLGEVTDVGLTSMEQTRLVLQLDKAGHGELRDRLNALFEEFAARSIDPAGERIALYLALYPER